MATQYGTPDYPVQAGVGEHARPEPAERTMVASALPEQSGPRHAAPSYDTAPDYDVAPGGINGPTSAIGVVSSGVDSPTTSLSEAAPTTLSGSDGFLAGNLAALSTPPASQVPGTPIGTLGARSGNPDPGFAGYSELGRTESRHARPEQPERYAERAADRYTELSGEAYREQPVPAEAHTMLVPQVGAGGYLGQPTSYRAEQPVRSVELVGAAYSAQSGAHRASARSDQLTESDTSALSSLDSSGLFGSLSGPSQ